VGTRQIGVVATTCPTCGAVAVYVGASKVGTINLARPRGTISRALVMLPRFTSKKSGVIRLVTTTKGRLVKIDGLATSAW